MDKTKNDTDREAQVNTRVVGERPAIAAGNLLFSDVQPLGKAAHISTWAQEQAYKMMEQATVQGGSSLMDADRRKPQKKKSDQKG